MNASVKLIEQVIPSTVSIQVTVPQHHHSAALLGPERMGSGALVDPEGYILTVNYIVIILTAQIFPAVFSCLCIKQSKAAKNLDFW